MSKEIERKWLVTGFPNIKPDMEYVIKQDYIESGETEVRLRFALPKQLLNWTAVDPYMSRALLTFKSSDNNFRDEVNIELTREQYNSLVPFLRHTKSVFKDYKEYHVDGKKIEVSQVDDNWFYAEVEFESQQEMDNFIFPWPEILVDEVTYNNFYKMKNYWNRKNASVV